VCIIYLDPVFILSLLLSGGNVIAVCPVKAYVGVRYSSTHS
jgi:hypothetical protein